MASPGGMFLVQEAPALCPASPHPTPEHPLVPRGGWKKMGNKTGICELDGGLRDVNKRVRYSVAAGWKEISVNYRRSSYKLGSLFLISASYLDGVPLK